MSTYCTFDVSKTLVYLRKSSQRYVLNLDVYINTTYIPLIFAGWHLKHDL